MDKLLKSQFSTFKCDGGYHISYCFNFEAWIYCLHADMTTKETFKQDIYFANQLNLTDLTHRIRQIQP